VTAAAAGRPAGTGLIPGLVGIRGPLAAVVVAVHLAPYGIALVPASAGVWTALWHHAMVALDVFFVLSGFVVAAGYSDVFRRWPGGRVFGRFLWARLSRFYPLHLAVLAALVGAVLVGGLAGIAVPHGGDLGWDLVRQLTLTQGWGGARALTWNGPAWSVGAEWACYLAVPLLLPLAARLRSTAAVVAGYLAAMAVPLVAYSVLGFDDAHLTYQAPLWRAVGGFLGGALLHRLTRVASSLPDRIGRLTDGLALAAVAAVVACSVAGVSSLWAAPPAGLVVLGLARRRRGVLDRLLSTRAALVGGELSVCVYLTHVPWIMAASHVLTPARFPGAWGWAAVALYAAGAVAVAWLAAVLVERPAQRLMRRLLPSRPRGPAPDLPGPRAAEPAPGARAPLVAAG
jgi:peptidoglycan/LPS O-acetylase OafA/YrhL